MSTITGAREHAEPRQAAATGGAVLSSAAIDRMGPVPMYHQLRNRIIDDITRLGLKPGDLLPGEHRMCEQFGVSRTVVRQALAQLEHEGVIDRVKGKGTFVAHQKTAESLVHTLAGLYEEVASRGGHVHSDVRRQQVEPASSEVADALQVEVGSPVVVIERLRFVDGEPWSLTTTWLPEASGRLVLDVDLRDQSLYAALAAHGVRAVRGVRSAEAASANAQQGELLGVGEGNALLVLRSISFDENDLPMEFFIAYHRGDRSRFEFQLQASLTTGSTAELRHTRL